MNVGGMQGSRREYEWRGYVGPQHRFLILMSFVLFYLNFPSFCTICEVFNFFYHLICLFIYFVFSGYHRFYSEVGIYKRKQEDTFSTKKAIKKREIERKKTRSRPRKKRKNFLFFFIVFLVESVFSFFSCFLVFF